MDAMQAALAAASSGLEVQSKRLRIAAENLANAQSTATTPGGDPYRRHTVAFAAGTDPETGARIVEISRLGTDPQPFQLELDPGHPAADTSGFVKLPNVNPLIELADMREANRSYEANLQVIKQAREIITMTIDLLRSNG
jgi:flagellar basal-body rod protein FlgC